MDILNIFSKNGGALARWITGIIVATITALIAKFGFEMSAADTAELSSFIGLIVAQAINEYISKKQSNNIKAIQEQVNKIAPEVEQDGHAGIITVSAVTKAVEILSDKVDAGTPPDGTRSERIEAKEIQEAMKPDGI